MSKREAAIALLEKILKPLDACEPQCKLNLNPEKIRQVIALLKAEQPPASEFTKVKVIEVIEKSMRTHEDWLGYFERNPDSLLRKEYENIGDIEHHRLCINDYAAAIVEIKDLCDRLDASEAENKKLKRPMECAGFNIDGMITVGAELIKRDTQITELKVSRKELAENLEMIVALLCHPGSFVNAKDIEKAEVALTKTKETNIQTKEK